MSVTVKECVKAKEVNGKPVYKVGLSDGRFGESFAKEIPVGTPVEDIQIEESQWGLKFKLISKNGFAGSAKQKAGNESFACAYAKDIVIAKMAHNPDLAKLHTNDITKVVIGVAEELYKWLETKKK